MIGDITSVLDRLLKWYLHNVGLVLFSVINIKLVLGIMQF